MSLFMAFFFLSIAMALGSAHAKPNHATPLGCSPFTGSVVLNEVNTKSDPDYIELYFLTATTVQADDWYLWIDGEKQISIPMGDHAAGEYLLLYANLNPSNQEVLLVSTASETLFAQEAVVLDYLGYGRAGNFHPNWQVPSACGTVYTDHSASEQVIDRLPDGTGSWEDHGDNATPGASNDGADPSCSLGAFEVQAQEYALACPDKPASVSVIALCSNGMIKSDYQGTLMLTSNQASARIYLNSQVGSPINQLTFDGSEGGVQVVYVSDNDEHLTTITVTDGIISGNDSIDFRTFGLLLSTLPAFEACTSHTATVTAYGQNSSASGCDVIEGFSGRKSLKAWFDYLLPNNNPFGTQLVLIDANGPQGLPLTQPGSDNIDLVFNAGIATFSLGYADAGQLQLGLQHDQAPYDRSQFDPLLASSNAFTVKPAGFSLRAYGMPGDIDLVNVTDSGEPKWPAGVDFRLQIRAQCADGAILGNYRPTDAEIWVEMLLPVAQHTGTLTFSGQSFPSFYTPPLNWSDVSALFADGVIADSPFDYSLARFSEVGVFSLHLRDLNYLGETLFQQSLAVGRFTPGYFEVTGTQDGQMQANCGSFSYTGKPSHYAIQPSLLITARNGEGVTTQNFTGGFMKLSGSEGGSIAFNPPISDASQLGRDSTSLIDLSASLLSNLATLQDHADGTLTYQLSPLDAFTYERNDNARIAPYISDIDLQLVSITDGDGITDNGDPIVLQPTGMELRYGRLLVDDAFGPQTDNLSIPVRSEYFDGNDFIDNIDDYCTLVTPVAAVVLSNWQGNLSNGDTAVLSSAGLLAGSGEIELSAPGPGSGGDNNDGSVDLTLNLSLTTPALPWLLNDENGDGVFADSPTGTASFGMYRGDDRFLYWRETQ